jgi:membrane protease YdiL (CAAX protease family)
MNNKTRIIYGLLLTSVVFAISTILGRKLIWQSDFVPSSIMTHTLMLVLSIGLIWGMKNYVDYRIAMPKFRQTLRPVLFGFLAAVIINLFLGMLTIAISGKVDAHPAVANASVLQFLLFDLILASVAEEFLFRGFLLNLLKPLKTKSFSLFKRKISISVLISAIAFGLAHLILIATGVGGLFVIRMVAFTFVLGLIAGYYQEKHDNHAFAILVHMAGNLMGVISIVLSSMIN